MNAAIDQFRSCQFAEVIESALPKTVGRIGAAQVAVTGQVMGPQPAREGLPRAREFRKAILAVTCDVFALESLLFRFELPNQLIDRAIQTWCPRIKVSMPD